MATTIRNNDGNRAVGTILAAGPARTTALDHGETYRGSATILGKDYATVYQPLKDAANTTVGLLFVGVPTAPTEAALAKTGLQALYIAVFVLGVLGLAVTFLLRRLLSPLVAMTNAMHHLANGDLGTVIPAMQREDQVGRMALALDVFKQQAIENARLAEERHAQRAQAEAEKRAALLAMAERIETEAGASVEAVSRETDRMAATTDRLAASAGRAGGDAKIASSAADAALANTQSVAAAAEELSASIREIASQVGRSTEIVARAVHTGHADSRIAELTAAVAQIGEVVGLITDIAARPTCWRSTPPSRRPAPARPARASPWSPTRSRAWPTRPPGHRGDRRPDRAVQSEARDAVGAIGGDRRHHRPASTSVDGHRRRGRAAGRRHRGDCRSAAATSGAAREVAARVASVSAEAVQSGAQAAEVHQHLAELARHVVDLKHVVVRIARMFTQEVDRRQEFRTTIDLPARLTLGGSASAHIVRLKDLSRHGAAVTGGPPTAEGARHAGGRRHRCDAGVRGAPNRNGGRGAGGTHSLRYGREGRGGDRQFAGVVRSPARAGWRRRADRRAAPGRVRDLR